MKFHVEIATRTQHIAKAFPSFYFPILGLSSNLLV